MAHIDPALPRVVGDFIDDLAPRVQALGERVEGIDPARLRADVAVEAYNLVSALIDADEVHTDDEIASFVATFAPVFGGTLNGATPETVRDSQLLTGKRTWLESPSVMFDLLVSSDLREQGGLAAIYYERAMKVAHTVTTLDDRPSAPELAAIERFRALLLEKMTPTAKSSTTDGTATPPPGDDAVDEEEELPPPRPLDELYAELDELIGLDAVKAEIRLVADLLQVQKMRADRGFKTNEQSRHMVFTGNPGTGKTTVARLLAEIYRTLGVVDKGHLVETDRSGLVAGFVGQTATKVVEAFDRADEGMLLIDEAYSLVRGGEKDFGREAIDAIVKLVEDRRDRIVVVAAGYPDEMSQFVDANPGLKSRFPKTIHFPDYSDDELVKIFEIIAEKNHYRPDDDALEAASEVFAATPRDKGFGNGRLARNVFESAVARQASRIVKIEKPSDHELVSLSRADIEGEPGPPDAPEPPEDR